MHIKTYTNALSFTGNVRIVSIERTNILETAKEKANHKITNKKTMNKKAINIFGALVSLTAMILAWYWYDWQLVVVILLATFGNNMERRGRT